MRLAERLAELAPMGEPVMSFLAQSGTESRRGGAQAGPLRHGAAPLHRLPGRLPRPDHGLARLHLEQVHPAEGLLPDHARRHPRALSQPLPAALRRGRPGTGGPRLHRARALPGQRAAERGGRDRRRADPGRGRLPRAPGRLPAGPARRSATGTASCSICDEVQAGVGRTGQDVRQPALGRGARHHDARQGPRLRPPHRRRRGEEADHGEVDPRAPTATPSAATPSAAPPPSRPSISWSASTPPTRRRWASTSWPGSASCSRATTSSATCAARA